MVDSRCHSLTASYVRDRHNYDESTPICSFYEGFDMEGRTQIIPPGIYSLDDLKEYGKDRNWCPYFLARFMVNNYLYRHLFLLLFLPTKLFIMLVLYRFYKLKL